MALDTYIDNTAYITPHLTQETYSDGRIVIFTVTSVHSQNISAWIDATRQAAIYSTPQSPVYVLHDVTHENMQMTPELYQQVDALSREFPQFNGYVALVTDKSRLLQITRRFIERVLGINQPLAEYRIFFEKQQALTWLTNKL